MLALFLVLAVDEPSSFDVFNILDEEQMVVTGSATAMKLRESPTSVWVVDERTLRISPMQTLYDALRTVPGINIIEYTQAQSEANLRFIGSFPEHHSLTLVDGRPVASDSFGSVDYSLIDPRRVEKIEVVLGPSSTLYGANAFSVVVNIVTKRPERVGHHLDLAAFGGVTAGNTGVSRNERQSWGPYTSGHAGYGYGWGSGGLKLSGMGSFAGSHGAQGIYAPEIVSTPVRQGAINFDITQAEKKSPYLFFEMSDARQQDYSAHLTIERERLNISLWGKYNRINFDSTYAGIERVPFDLRTASTEARIAYTLPTFANNTLTLGAQARGIFTSLGDPSPERQLAAPGQSQLLAGVFVEDNYRPIEPLVLTAGVRVDTREMAATRAFQYL